MQAISDFNTKTGLLYNDISKDNVVYDDRVIIRDPYGMYFEAAYLNTACRNLEFFLSDAGIKDGNLNSFHRDIPGFTEFWVKNTEQLIQVATRKREDMQPSPLMPDM